MIQKVHILTFMLKAMTKIRNLKLVIMKECQHPKGPGWSKEVFGIKKLKILYHGNMLLMTGTFYKKELQKTSETEFLQLKK